MNTIEPGLPDYLKSLQALLEPKQQASTGGATAAANPLSLSTIGFGHMFPPPSTSTSTSAPSPNSNSSDPSKLKFLLVSTHAHQFTGYSKVSYGILQELSKEPWLQTTHFGFQHFQDVGNTYRPYPPNVDVIDAAALEKPVQQGFGYSLLPDVIRKRQPHVVMLYNDLFVVARFLEEIRTSGIPRNFQIWVYVDQVYPVQNQAFLDILNRDADRVFAFSAYWKKVLKDQGITRPIDLLHHGFFEKQNFPISKDLARKQLSLPKDVFLFLNVNRNQPRKRYDLLIMAFVELITKYPTKPIFLLCLCDKGEKGGWPLFELFANEFKTRGVEMTQDFATRLIITQQNMSFKDEDINLFYNAADVGISTADGEGWGLCQFEQMGVGVPQVVPAIGGFKEYCTPENSVLVEAKTKYYLPNVYIPVGGLASACLPHDICLAMEEYVHDSVKREKHGIAARETVLKYTWKRACETLIRRLQTVKDDKDE
jgi:glycosyltransferase involved in cell wall biosynthesis